MVDKEDLGLSLSLGFATITTNNLHHNFTPISFPSSSSSSSVPQNPSWIVHQTLQSSDPIKSDSSRTDNTPRFFLRGIDVNRLPATVDCEEEAGVSSPNSTLSSISGKRSERSSDHQPGNLINVSSEDLVEMERASSRRISDEEDGDNSKKKLRLSKDQSAVLEESFIEHNTLTPKQKLGLAKQLGLRPRQVEVWFQNRRARTKLKQTEVDCEFLKKCCDNLTEENKRLQKEVQELRTLKLSPQLYMQMTPPTTLTMCPSCERVAAVPSPHQPQPPQPSSSSALLTQHLFRSMPINPWAPPPPPHHGPFDVARRR